MYQSTISVLDSFISPAICALSSSVILPVRLYFLLYSSSLQPPVQAVSPSNLLPSVLLSSPYKILQNILNDVTSNSLTSFTVIVY